MTQPNWNGGAGADIPSEAFAAGAAGGLDFEGRTEDAVKTQLQNQKTPGIKSAYAPFNNGLIGTLVRVLTGSGGNLAAELQNLADLLTLRWLQVDRAEQASSAASSQAQIALDAAQAADRKVTSLLQGGIRTVYTSNFTYYPPEGVFKIGVLLYGGGRRGAGPWWGAPGGLGGGLIYAEFLIDALPAGGIQVTIGAGSGSYDQPSYTSFGGLVSSSDSGGGILQNSTLLALASSVFPGNGGNAALVVGNPGQGSNGANTLDGDRGGATALAAGGSPNGGAGGNAPVTGQYLAGGGGGGGGRSSNMIFGGATNGGAGGFPGGGGGGAGRNANEAYWVPGYGAPGLCAIIEFTEAPQ